MAGRGQLTEEVKAKSKELLGYEINKVQLRLMPYLQWVVINNKIIEGQKVNNHEWNILEKWKTEGLIIDITSRLKLSKRFWDAMSEILWMSYADTDI